MCLHSSLPVSSLPGFHGQRAAATFDRGVVSRDEGPGHHIARPPGADGECVVELRVMNPLQPRGSRGRCSSPKQCFPFKFSPEKQASQDPGGVVSNVVDAGVHHETLPYTSTHLPLCSGSSVPLRSCPHQRLVGTDLYSGTCDQLGSTMRLQSSCRIRGGLVISARSSLPPALLPSLSDRF